MTQPTLPSSITMTLDQYTSLVALARDGAKARGQNQGALETFLISIEKANSITRYLMWVRWQELDAPLPPNTRFPTNWPPNLSHLIQQINKPISLADVNAAVTQYAKNPTNVMVTKDPGATLGWTQLAAAFPGETD